MAKLLSVLRRTLAPDRIQSDPEVLAAYAQDRALFETAGRAAMVTPRSTEEVVAAVEADVPKR